MNVTAHAHDICAPLELELESPSETSQAFSIEMPDKTVQRIRELQRMLSQKENSDINSLSIDYRNDITLDEEVTLCGIASLPVKEIIITDNGATMRGEYDVYTFQVVLNAFSSND